MTLLEVVLSVAIFFLAMAAIYHLIDLGQRNALESRLQSQAVFRAEQIMAEVVAGAVPLQSTGETAFADGAVVNSPTAPRSGEWTWSLDVLPWGLDATMQELVVTVRHRTSVGEENATFTLRRIIRDPVALATLQADLEAARAELEAQAAEE
jgi:hypothetical protein